MAPGQLRSLIGSIRRKPASAPDHRDDSDAAVNGTTEKKTSVTHDLIHGGHKTRATIAEALTTLASGEPMDDKKLMLEHGVAMLQSLPLNSGLSAKVSDGFIKMLYDDLPHPSATIAGPEARYRRHDGGNNNLWSPEMGKAGTPYARNVPPSKPKGPNLPDPELVFEQLLKREDGAFREHPSGLNRMFFSFATVVIHECFQTSRTEPWINETSSYVDLSTLYGNTEKEQKRVRTYTNGTIYPDSIASERIMLMPPGVVATLLLFSRNHNQIAESLLSVNEDGKYRDWDSLDDKGKAWQDNDVFQLARNINVGFFATVVLKDYVAAILNTPRADSTWSLDLGKEIKAGANRVERGAGNVVSVEFAVLYHWHAALSAADAKWMEELLRWNLPDLKSLDDMTPEMFYEVVKKEGHKLMTTPPKDWTFNNLKRGPDGHFNNLELAELIKDCIEEPAHAFGPHGTPASLKVVDIMGQLQARDLFNVCTMNEFRKYLNLKPYDTFEDWCEDGPTARAAELLYGHIDNLELYPGLMAECTKPAIPGSGVCPGQTTGRGILDDAVALVRGDRFLSYDLNSNTLTNWGVSKLADIPHGSYGGMLPKLIFRGLPSGFTGTSSYALLPFYTPKAVAGILKNNKVVDQYDMARPPSDLDIVAVQTLEGCKKVFEDRDTFINPEQKVIKDITGGNEMNTANGISSKQIDHSEKLRPLFFEDNFEANVSTFFREKVRSQIKSCSLKYPSTRRSLDVVRDVTNITPILWLAERFAIPLKTPQSPRGLLSVPQVFDMYSALFRYLTFNVIPENEWGLRDSASRSAASLRRIIETHLKTQQGFKEKIVDRLTLGTAYEVNPVADRLYHALIATKQPVADLASECIGVGAPAAGNLTQQASLLIDLYLSEGYEQYKARIVELAQKENDPAADKELEGFVYEGMRHAGVVPGLPRVAAHDATITDGARGYITVKANQPVLLATSVAAMDPAAFPDPGTLNPNRDFKEYALIGHGMHHSFGQRLIGPALAATLKEVFRLKNIRRAEGRRGRFSIVEQEVAGLKMRKYLDSNSRESAVPTTLTVEYDE